ncbi:hypothetical protein CR513_40148, partial [Mucuna pruriens]
MPPKLRVPRISTIPYTIGNSHLKKALHMTIAHPRGVIEDVLVEVDKFIFPIDFVVLDMEGNKEVLIILERPFLNSKGTLINIRQGKLTLRLDDEETIHDIKGINPTVCTHRIYMEDDYEPQALPQCHLDLNMKEMVKGELYENSHGSPRPRETTFTYPYRTFAYKRMSFGLQRSYHLSKFYAEKAKCVECRLALDRDGSGTYLAELYPTLYRLRVDLDTNGRDRVELDSTKVTKYRSKYKLNYTNYNCTNTEFNKQLVPDSALKTTFPNQPKVPTTIIKHSSAVIPRIYTIVISSIDRE